MRRRRPRRQRFLSRRATYPSRPCSGADRPHVDAVHRNPACRSLQYRDQPISRATARIPKLLILQADAAHVSGQSGNGRGRLVDHQLITFPRRLRINGHETTPSDPGAHGHPRFCPRRPPRSRPARCRPPTTSASCRTPTTRGSSCRTSCEYPRTVGEILRRDPSLMARPDYMAPYPQLAGFLAQHPEVAAKRRVLLRRLRLLGAPASRFDPEFEALGVLLGGMAGFFGFSAVHRRR